MYAMTARYEIARRAVTGFSILVILLLLPLRVCAADLPTVSPLQDRLAAEVQKIIDAGHLAPGICYCEQHYTAHTGSGAHWAWDDYWHNPADLVYTLSIAIPHLPAGMRPAAMTYLENEFNAYPPYTYVHIGTSGVHRSFNGVPAEYQSNWGNLYGVETSAHTTVPSGQEFTFYPFNIYACWKFAQLFPARVNEIRTACQGKLQQMSDNIPLQEANPHIVNMYIAGCYGYQGLRQLAGLQPDATVQTWLNNALAVRVQILDYNPAALEGFEAGGFCWLVPELGQYLRNNALPRVQEILAYEDWARPYWYIARAQECTRYYSQRIFMEGYHAPIYDYFSLFAARAHILQLNQQELEEYLDAPAVWRGDLYYIQNLVYTMNASTSGNSSPTVDAGGNQTITLPDNDISLDAAVSDDGLPNPPAVLTQTWTVQSGPGTVTFADVNAVDTTATFATTGVYVLRLTVSDSELTTYDEVTITVNPEGGPNQAPTVDAGGSQTITLPDNDVNLDGTVGDDGLPNPPAVVTQTWAKQSGPGMVTFANANAVDTAATFSTSGTYVLRLTASDSDMQAYDDVTITVNAAPANHAPNVDAGLSQSITLPVNFVNLDATVTDDGLPNPPATATQTWTKQSGPGTVTFADADAVDTSATFSSAGIYKLRLTADDGQLQACDELTVAVYPEGGGEPDDYVLYYRLDEGGGGSVADSSTSGNNANLVGGPAWTYHGKVYGALTLDGVDDYVNCTSEANTANLPTGDFTVAWWMNWNQDLAQLFDTIMGKYGHNGTASAGWEIYLAQDVRRLNVSILFDGTNMLYRSANNTIPVNTWVHLAVVYQAVDKTARIYIDGTEPGYSTQTPGAGNYKTDSGIKTQFGRADWSSNYFRGMLDDIRIYPRALSDLEIQALINSVPPAGDFNRDGLVDAFDLAFMAEQWLATGDTAMLQTDILGSGCVDFADFAQLAEDWLK